MLLISCAEEANERFFMKLILSSLILSSFTAIAVNVEDIRTVLDFYRQEDDILEAFKRNQARLREAEEARRNQLNQKHGGTSTWSGMFGRSFSFGRSSNKSVS